VDDGMPDPNAESVGVVAASKLPKAMLPKCFGFEGATTSGTSTLSGGLLGGDCCLSMAAANMLA